MLIDPRHPFFRRLWVRVLSALLPLLWAGVELASGSVFWAILFAAAGVYLVVALFIIRREEP
jgi:hypothetical protein